MSSQHCRNIVSDRASEWEDRDQHGALIDPVITPRSQTVYIQTKQPSWDWDPRFINTDYSGTCEYDRSAGNDQPYLTPTSRQCTNNTETAGVGNEPRTRPSSIGMHAHELTKRTVPQLPPERTHNSSGETENTAQLSTHTTALGELGSPQVGRGDKTAEISTTVQDKSPADCHARRRRQPVAGAWWQGPHDRSLPASAPQPGRRARRARPRRSSHRAVAQQPSMKWSKRGAGSSTRLTRHKARYAQRPKEVCEIRGANYPAPFHNSLYGLCGTEPKSFVKEEVAVFGSPSLILPRVCVDVKRHRTESHPQQVLSEQRDRWWCDANSTR